MFKRKLVRFSTYALIAASCVNLMILSASAYTKPYYLEFYNGYNETFALTCDPNVPNIAHTINNRHSKNIFNTHTVTTQLRGIDSDSKDVYAYILSPNGSVLSSNGVVGSLVAAPIVSTSYTGNVSRTRHTGESRQGNTIWIFNYSESSRSVKSIDIQTEDGYLIAANSAQLKEQNMRRFKAIEERYALESANRKLAEDTQIS